MFWKRASTGGMFFQRRSRLVCFGWSRVEGDNPSVNVLEFLGMVVYELLLFFWVYVGASPRTRVVECCCRETARRQCSGCVVFIGERSSDLGLRDALSGASRS